MKRLTILMSIGLIYTMLSHATTIIPENDKHKKDRIETESSNEAITTWKFYSSFKEPSTKELSNADNYVFGQKAAIFRNQFMGIYIVKEDVVPGDPTQRIVIRKPIIYKAVCSIEKALKKEIKSNKKNSQQASEELINIFKIAISAFDSDSKSFEEALQKNRKDNAALLTIFNNVKLLEI